MRGYQAGSVRRWLAQGWRDFRATAAISMGFSAIFVAIGLLALWLLFQIGQVLLILPLLTGFMLVAPILLTGYQRAARLLRQGEQPRFRDLPLGIREGTPGIWFLTAILSIGYLIWVTDAFVLYGIYFGFKTVSLESALFSDAEMRRQLTTYLLFSSVAGLFMATLSFVASVFSIPLILHRRLPFINAVHASVVTVFRHPLLMARWAFTLAALTLLTLIFALPLLVVTLPVLAYASYAAYADLLPNGVPPHTG